MTTLTISFWENLKRIISTSFWHLCTAVFFWRKRKSDIKITNSNFSVDSYLEDIEKVYLSILEEQEKQDPYRITLWWGLDGCRLNDAGEVEWINRRKKPKASYAKINNTVYFHSSYLSYPTSQLNSVAQSIDAGICQMTGNINSSIQSQINSIQILQFQAAQMSQNAYICDTIGPISGRDLSGRIIR